MKNQILSPSVPNLPALNLFQWFRKTPFVLITLAAVLLLTANCLLPTFSFSQSSRLWATYYGGTDDDRGYSVATDASGNVYLAGSTKSASGIGSGGFQNTYGGGSAMTGDAYLVKFDATGTRLWATYYGGSGGEYAKSVATDAAGNVYLAGYTTSTSGIGSGGFQNIYGGGFTDAFLVKFDGGGNRLWATYYGGADREWGYGVATDVDGNVYLAGQTRSITGIASGGFQNTFGGGIDDAFLVKFDASGNRLWATYYGGADRDWGYEVVTNAAGNVYLAGTTRNATGIASGGFQNTYGGGSEDAFLVKFDASGNRLWATYYGRPGGMSSFDPYDIATDASGNAYMAGTTGSSPNMASGGFQNTPSGIRNVFLVKFNAAGNRLCATYYGETSFSSVATSVSGNVYLAGCTSSPTGIASGGFQNTYGGGFSDGHLVKFCPCTNCSVLSATASSTNINCNGQCTGTATANPVGGTSPYTYLWNTTPPQTTSSATGLCAGTYTVTVTSADSLNTTTAATVTITQPTAILLSASSTQSSCSADTGTATAIPSGGTPGYTYLWSTTPVQTTITATGLGSETYTVTVTDLNGCTKTQTVTVTSNSVLSVSVSSTQTGCTVNNGTATAIPNNGTVPYTYSWNNGQTTQIATGLGAETYTVTITDASGCTQTQTVSITQMPGPTATANATPVSVILGNSTQLIATGGGTYQWSPSVGLSCVTCANPTATPLQTTTYCVLVTDNNGCTDSDCIRVEILCGNIFIPNAFSPNNDGENDVLKVYGNCIKEMNIIIYNRWGEKVFASKDLNFQWDGTDHAGIFQGGAFGTAVFVYYINATFIDGTKIFLKGNISLIR